MASLNQKQAKKASAKYKKSGRFGKVGYISEAAKEVFHKALSEFQMDEKRYELTFQPGLSKDDRAYIHNLAKDFGFKSKSKGNGVKRYITVVKQRNAAPDILLMDMEDATLNSISHFLAKFPLGKEEWQDLAPPTQRSRKPWQESKETSLTAVRLNRGIPQIPPPNFCQDFAQHKQSLPICSFRQQILDLLAHERVILISGETGSGKTTQVPQFILEDCHASQTPCRIICTQPRRMAALTIAERVSAERGEMIGNTVGYQIRLESKVSPKTLLTFCTTGVLLRTLMSDDDSGLASVTHLIVDEIHERDRFCDFLLTVIRQNLARFAHLRVILMSAALDLQLFLRYFNNCPTLNIPGRMYPVQEHFLEDVLRLTNHLGQNGPTQATPTRGMPLSSSPEVGLSRQMDQVLERAWKQGDDAAFLQILEILYDGAVSVDYRHSETDITALMVAAGHGKLAIVEQLIGLGANPTLKINAGWNCVDFAQRMNYKDVADMLKSYLEAYEQANQLVPTLPEQDDEAATLLEMYHEKYNDDFTNLDLVIDVIYHIHCNQAPGAVLVFLPGYDEIVALKEELLHGDRRFANAKLHVYALHSSMQSADQRRVFDRSPAGFRKIILSTNVAETSITVDDVVYVIDSGKVKEKSYDALSGVTALKAYWISQASALQRKGRAGRCQPGVCYRLFSKFRFQNMQAFQTPEMLRVPLQELCLHSKLLAPRTMSIVDFLSQAPEAPPLPNLRTAVDILKTIDAIDAFEDVTPMGFQLLDLPLEPRLGKMLLASVILKCLDPVLTLVCLLAYKEPYLLPSDPALKKKAQLMKNKLAAGSLSDHMALLRCFQLWQRAQSEGYERQFCEDYLVSAPTLELIGLMRSQILAQLRASGFVKMRGAGDIRDLNTNAEIWALVKAALTMGVYPQIARCSAAGRWLQTEKVGKARFHVSSTLLSAENFPEVNQRKKTPLLSQESVISNLPSDFVLYEELTRPGHIPAVRCCTVVSPLTVALFAGPARLQPEALKRCRPSDLGLEDSDDDSEDDLDGWSSECSLNSDELAELCELMEDLGQDDLPWLESAKELHTDKKQGRKSQPARKKGGAKGAKGQKGLAGAMVRPEEESMAVFELDNSISFAMDWEDAKAVTQLRQKWQALFIRRMKAPLKSMNEKDEALVRELVSVLSMEDQCLGFTQPSGIGQRPVPVVPGNVGHSVAAGHSKSPLQKFAKRKASFTGGTGQFSRPSSQPKGEWNNGAAMAAQRTQDTVSVKGDKKVGSGRLMTEHRRSEMDSNYAVAPPKGRAIRGKNTR